MAIFFIKAKTNSTFVVQIKYADKTRFNNPQKCLILPGYLLMVTDHFRHSLGSEKSTKFKISAGPKYTKKEH